MDKLSYAVALLDGASRIARTAVTSNIAEIGIPFYLLIGFSLENGLKALLYNKGCTERGWHRSHDLSALLALARGYKLEAQLGIFEIVDGISLYHSQYWFRYPEKAGVANVVDAVSALYATDFLLRRVYELTETSLALWPRAPVRPMV